MKTRKLIEQSILLMIDSIKDDVKETFDEKENLIRAEAVKRLAEAYNLVHRGKAD